MGPSLLIRLGLVVSILITKEALAQKPQLPPYALTLVRTIKMLKARLDNRTVIASALTGFIDGDEISPSEQILHQIKNYYTNAIIAKYYSAQSRGKRSTADESKVNHRQKRAMMNFNNEFLETGKWPNGEIFYALNTTFSAAQKAVITEALSWWTSKTCIRFTEVFPGNNPTQPYVLFTPGASCVSFVGRTIENIPQPTYLDANCFQLVGRIAHEVGHSIGLWHTHQLSTRTDYVDVLPNNMNVQNDGEIVDLPASLISYYNLPYDFASLMHYDPRIFAKPGLNTIETRDPLFRQTIGQRSEISFQDARAVNTEYCATSCRNQIRCQNGGYQNPANCGRCLCPDGWTGTLCSNLATQQCGGEVLVDGRGGSISSPGFDQRIQYRDNILCAWRLRNTLNQNIVLEFDDRFGVYCFGNTAFHWVELRINGTLYDTGYRFCGNEKPRNVFVSVNPSKEVVVIFKSPYNAPSSFTRTGFKLAYRLENQVGCNVGGCQNGGSCITSTGVCQCPTGFRGSICEIDDRCNQGYCQNGGSCTIRPSAVPLCDCPTGYSGTRCQVKDPENPQADCGACDLPAGETQVACDSPTEKEEYEVSCDSLDSRRFWFSGGDDRRGRGRGGGRGRGRARQQLCTVELPKKYCCQNAKLMRVNDEFLCGVPGWSDWGPCQGDTCGGCGIRRRSQYQVLNLFERGCWNDRMIICGEDTSGCNFTPCPISDCNSQVQEEEDGDHHHHGGWWGKRRRRKRGLFDWLFGGDGGGRGGGDGGWFNDGECVNQCCMPYQLSSDGSTCSDGSTPPEVDPAQRNPVTPSTTTTQAIEIEPIILYEDRDRVQQGNQPSRRRPRPRPRPRRPTQRSRPLYTTLPPESRRKSTTTLPPWLLDP